VSARPVPRVDAPKGASKKSLDLEKSVDLVSATCSTRPGQNWPAVQTPSPRLASRAVRIGGLRALGGTECRDQLKTSYADRDMRTL
jgi:hypothetical protein